MPLVIITQEMLDTIPGLKERGYEVGQEVEIDEKDLISPNEPQQPQTDEGLDGDPPPSGDPGGNNPPRKPNLP